MLYYHTLPNSGPVVKYAFSLQGVFKYGFPLSGLPPIFDANSDLEEKFISNARKNVTNLSPELKYECCDIYPIHHLMWQEKKESNDQKTTFENKELPNFVSTPY